VEEPETLKISQKIVLISENTNNMQVTKDASFQHHTNIDKLKKMWKFSLKQ